MKLAAIDIGSNSIHMIVARVEGDGTIETIDRIKEMARLGAETLATGYLSEAAQERGLDALRRFRALADGYKVDDILAVATSATREARNGQEFIRRVADECDIHARIIDGYEEGRYIYLGAREVHDFGDQRSMIIDIGGGSVEFIIADRRREYLTRSLKLGVRRLRERFLGSDPPTPDEITELEGHVRATLDYHLRAMRRRGFEGLIATSGTANALARITRELSPPSETAPPGWIPTENLADAVQQLCAMTAAERDTLSSLDDKRRDSILAGAVLLRTLVQVFGGRGLQMVDGALREGLIVDYVETNRPGLRLATEVPDPRRRSVLLLARRFYDYQGHSRHVAHLALRLFDQMQKLHGCHFRDRELLDYAALLHNIGTAVARSGHHKHSLYLIRHAELRGFSDREIQVMANIARYHRRSAPKSRHEEYMALDPTDRELVKKLSALLRIANALDRGRRANVTSLRATIDKETVTLHLRAHTDPSIELSVAREQAPHFEKVFGRMLRFEEETP